MKSKNHIALLILIGIALVALVLVGCEGKQGPAGPQGPGSPVDTTTIAYLGDNTTNCGHCHAGTVSQWETTNHAMAFDTLVAENEDTVKYCLQCHTTGFDDKYSFNGTLISQGVNNGGYDDHPRPELTGVQCESCHGPMGPNQAQHVPELTNVLNSQACRQCHEQPAEYDSSGHAMAAVRTGATCIQCHTSEGFIMAQDASDHPSGSLTPANPVTCVTCHDPHNKTNDKQLRTVGTATGNFTMAQGAYGSYDITGLGFGQLCAQCHHGRADSTSVFQQLTLGNAHPGPHHSPQADMYTGNGAFELPGTIARGPLHPQLTNACVDCHMYSIERGNTGGPLFGHSFKPDIRKCQTCHPAATTFDIGGVQTETEVLLDSLGALLPHDGTGAVRSAIDTVNWTMAQRQAGYTYFFVEDDGSKGVHNRDYAQSVLRAAIQSLTPGKND